MKKILKPKSEFNRNVLTLVTGTTIAQSIPVAITPILTRLYAPEDFGLLALFVALTAIIGSIACGRYELAIILPEDDEDAINIGALCLFISIGLSVLLLVIVTVFNGLIADLLDNKGINLWLYFVPFVVLMSGISNTLKYLNTRKVLYRDIAKANVYRSLGLASVQVSVGFLKSGATGLISGQIVAPMISNFMLAKTVFNNFDTKTIKTTKIKRLAKRYQDFPKFSMWAILANTMAYNLTNILISINYGLGVLGFYSLGQRLLAMPTSFIGGAIGQVYFQQANIEKQEVGNTVGTFTRTCKKLIILSVTIFIPLYFILPALFEIVFGHEWRIAGEYAQITLPFVGAQFVVSALTTTNSIFEKQKISLIWQVGLLFFSVGIIILSSFFEIGFVEFLKIFSGFLFLYYGLLLSILWRVSHGK